MIGAKAIRSRYHGGRATGYEDRRSGRSFWKIEHSLVQSMLSDLSRGSSVLDIPVGTGRYAEIYKAAGFVAVGMDVSSDMMSVAREKADGLGFVMDVRYGDALNIDAKDRSFDAVVCTRLVNWFLPDEMVTAVRELTRVCRDRVIISIEIGTRKSDEGNKPHEPKAFARALKLAGAVEEKRSEISRNYWMVQLGLRP